MQHDPETSSRTLGSTALSDLLPPAGSSGGLVAGVLALLFLAAGTVPVPAPAQEAGGAAAADPACNFTAPPEELAGRTSPADSATASVDGGAVKLCYSRPSARDRTIMGGLVPYGQPWRLGANEATMVRLTFPATIAGVEVEPGAYSLYVVPGREEWTVVVNAAAERWGIPINDEVMARDVGRGTVPAESTDAPVEQLTLSLEDAGEGAVDLVVAWERTRVVIPIRRVSSGY